MSFKITCSGFVVLAAASFVSAQAFATPVCPAGMQGSTVCVATAGGDGAGSSLQQQLDKVTTKSGDIDVSRDQVHNSAFWSIGGSGASENALMMELAGHASGNTFGIFDPANPNNYLQLFTGPATKGWTATLYNDGKGQYTANLLNAKHQLQASNSATFGVTNTFGYYLQTPDGSFFFSDPSLNGGYAQMVAYAGSGRTHLDFAGHRGAFNSGEYLLAWEDQLLANSDGDYNDFVVVVESVKPVPEPATLGMFGLGALMIGFAMRRRRREPV